MIGYVFGDQSKSRRRTLFGYRSTYAEKSVGLGWIVRKAQLKRQFFRRRLHSHLGSLWELALEHT